MTLADRIKDARAARRWNREVLSAVSGVSVSTIGRIERGEEMQPRAGSIIALAVALEIPPQELAAEAGIEIFIPKDKWS
jgi:transcriptional regulator with XRE-family HTH domain